MGIIGRVCEAGIWGGGAEGSPAPFLRLCSGNKQQAWDGEEINISCPCILPLPPTPLAIHRALSTGRSARIQEVPSSYNYPQLANEVCRVAGPPVRTRVCASLPVLVVGTAVIVITADLGFYLLWHLSLPTSWVMQTCLQHLSSAVYGRAVNPPPKWASGRTGGVKPFQQPILRLTVAMVCSSGRGHDASP